MSAIVAGSSARSTFQQRAEQAGCRVIDCSAAELRDATWWDRLLAAETMGTGRSAGDGAPPKMAVAPSLVERFPAAARLLQEQGAVCTGDPAILVSCAAGVSACAAAVAETGSLLLAGAEPSDRLAWLLPPRCVLLVRVADVLPSLDDAMAWLQAHPSIGAATLVTGPSRTSDVERVLTIGIQGPREVVVVLVAGSED